MSGNAHRSDDATYDRSSLLRSLIDTYSRPLSRYFARRVSSGQDVPDLVQEVFLRLSTLDDPASIRQRDSFIFVTAANVLKDRYRRERTGAAWSATDPIDDMDMEGSDFAPDRVLESKQAADLIRRALAELPDRTRAVFVRRMIEGMKMADIADVMMISTRAAEKHQARALAHVAERLREWRRD
ncbi:RNA polymerase sigma factor [Sphingomonas sp. M1-B02]|uniref:RNA polymerase sigma factor n=1 Tax=Sphingomonas sp. M1-B02 TaxID=3114300 RepID=UPI00223EC736|nr:sigma-70 family RNA polymerase sigma factor [Sphingomonas sp. S6-11]UZK67321.1 sigma-70 family RNA polymerase sigma factor [Sphingomonas sp. S6-11]